MRTVSVLAIIAIVPWCHVVVGDEPKAMPVVFESFQTRLAGSVALGTIRIETEVGTLEIPASMVRHITYSGVTPSTESSPRKLLHRIRTTIDGDAITGVIVAPETITVVSRYGTVKTDWAKVSGLHFSANARSDDAQRAAPAGEPQPAAKESPLPRSRVPEDKEAGQPEASRGPWRAFGRVTDRTGRPLAGVAVRASCGSGSLHCTGVATSGDDGRYTLDFGPGIVNTRGNGAPLQAATISAHKAGHFEENLSRQGDCLAAAAMPADADLKRRGGRKDRLFLPDHPLELNFVLLPAGRVAGRLVDEQGKPLAHYSVALTGAELPPSSSALSAVETDEQGRFSLAEIPTNHRYQFEVRKANPRPPWDDTWASAALRFGAPDKDDLHAWFGDREIRLEHLIVRVAGPGVHGRIATPTAAIAGVLDLTTDAPSDLVERKDERLVATSAVLTLRNGSRPEPSVSLIAESVPAASAHESKTRLARTRPNDAGEFTVAFENPRGVDLVRGKHQVIFQAFVGVSRQPIREKIFHQLEIRDGRYEVPVKIAPEWIADSRVSITFVSIQPEHDAWVKAFFHEGRGTRYSGLWISDGNVLPAIPFETGHGK